MTSGLLDDLAAAELWERRHRTQTDLRSGGDIGRSEEENEFYYGVRLGQLISHIGLWSSVTHPVDVLDAGCGGGYFAARLSRGGHRLVGVDRSPTAIAKARSSTSNATYVTADLATFGWYHAFDVVYVIDVLFHILDDDKWWNVLANLSAHLRPGGRLIVTDTLADSISNSGDYIRYRPARAYANALAHWGRYSFAGTDPFHVANTRLGFHVFNRTGS